MLHHALKGIFSRLSECLNVTINTAASRNVIGALSAH
jgi:hypothetical protein